MTLPWLFPSKPITSSKNKPYTPFTPFPCPTQTVPCTSKVLNAAALGPQWIQKPPPSPTAFPSPPHAPWGRRDAPKTFRLFFRRMAARCSLPSGDLSQSGTITEPGGTDIFTPGPGTARLC